MHSHARVHIHACMHLTGSVRAFVHPCVCAYGIQTQVWSREALLNASDSYGPFKVFRQKDRRKQSLSLQMREYLKWMAALLLKSTLDSDFSW
jgi:hypothetical protein